MDRRCDHERLPVTDLLDITCGAARGAYSAASGALLLRPVAYGVMSYAVTNARSSWAGAWRWGQAADLLRLVFGAGGDAGGLGIAVGLALAPATRLIANLLFDVSARIPGLRWHPGCWPPPQDASLLPALRATRRYPTLALCAE